VDEFEELTKLQTMGVSASDIKARSPAAQRLV